MNSEDEEKNRFELFKTDYIHVKIHNQGYLKNETTFSTCLNQFSVLSENEYLTKYTIQRQTSEIKMPDDMPPPSLQFDTVEIPNSFDWRTLNMVSQPENQKKCGGCW